MRLLFLTVMTALAVALPVASGAATVGPPDPLRDGARAVLVERGWGSTVSAPGFGVAGSGVLRARVTPKGVTFRARFEDETARHRHAVYTIPWTRDERALRPHRATTEALTALVLQTMLEDRIPTYFHFDRWELADTRIQGQAEGRAFRLVAARGPMTDLLAEAWDDPARGLRMRAFGTFDAGGASSGPGTPRPVATPTPAGPPLLLGALGVLGALAFRRHSAKA